MRLLLIVCFAFATVSVRAQTRALTVEEAIEKARSRAPERLRSEALERQAEGLKKNASAFFTERPEVEVEYMSERPFGARDYEFSIGVSQEIPISGVEGGRTAHANAVRNASEISSRALDRQIALRTRLLYNRAWALSQQVALGNRLIASSNKLVDASNKRLAAGDMSTLDRNTVILEANRQKIEHERVHAMRDQAIGELEALTGMSLLDADLQMDTANLGAMIVDTASLYTIAPDYARLEGEIRIAEARLDLARSEALSNPTLGLHYSQDLMTVDADEVEYAANAVHNIQGVTAPGRAAGLSLSLQLPISIPGIWGPNNLEVIERETELWMLEAERAALQLQLSGKIARLRPQLSRAKRALEIYQESAPVIQENHELLDRGYEGGELSVTELLVGRQQLIELQTRQLALIQEMREAEIELQSILGR
jgi:outer membrane protein, heavy metal efflux system